MHVEPVDFVSVPTRAGARAVAGYRDVPGLPQGTGVRLMGFVKDPDGDVVVLNRRYAPRGQA